MQQALPVFRHAPLRTWRRLSDWMMMGRSKRGAISHAAAFKIPEPAFSRLEALDHRVPCAAVVLVGMTRRRRVAAADMTALRAAAQMKPPSLRLLTFQASCAARLRSWIHMLHSGIPLLTLLFLSQVCRKAIHCRLPSFISITATASAGSMSTPSSNFTSAAEANRTRPHERMEKRQSLAPRLQ